MLVVWGQNFLICFGLELRLLRWFGSCEFFGFGRFEGWILLRLVFVLFMIGGLLVFWVFTW